MPEAVHQYRDQLEGRSIWVRKATILPVEAIVRGYITGEQSGIVARTLAMVARADQRKIPAEIATAQAQRGQSTKSRARCTT